MPKHVKKAQRVLWLGSSLSDLKKFPLNAKREVGYQLMKKNVGKIKHVTSTGANVFSDLGFDNQEAAKLKIKSQLMMEVSEWIKSQSLTQEAAANILGISRPRVSDVTTGKIDKFTIDALVDLLERTGKHVTVNVA